MKQIAGLAYQYDKVLLDIVINVLLITIHIWNGGDRNPNAHKTRLAYQNLSFILFFFCSIELIPLVG